MRIGAEVAQAGEAEGAYESPPPGTYRATIAKFWDCGIHRDLRDAESKPKRKVCVAVELGQDIETGKVWRDAKGRVAVMFLKFNASLFKKEGKPTSYLRAFLDKILPTMAEAQIKETGDVDTTAWECEPCRVNVVAGPKRAEIETVMPAKPTDERAKLEADYAEPFGLAKWLIENQVK